MVCELSGICGGCPLRCLDTARYQEQKLAAFRETLKHIRQDNIAEGKPVFVPDHPRRRASLAFSYKKGRLSLGFNAAKSAEIVNLSACPLLTSGLNAVLPAITRLLEDICAVPCNVKKGKKTLKQNISCGDVWLTEAANGIDVVLEFDAEPELEHRMIVFEQAQAMPSVIRISHRRSPSAIIEPLVEKARPCIKIGGYDVYIPAGTFLQPSAEGEQALTGLVQKYMGDSEGAVADLFCGVGTFSYPLARNPANRDLAVDSSRELLAGFQESVNRNMITNIRIMPRNLFKYPLDSKELQGFDVVVFDPPRAGAAAQAGQLAMMETAAKPSKVIAVSCNPQSFVRDAGILLEGGYRLVEVTLVDQFIYSNHSELVALFTKL